MRRNGAGAIESGTVAKQQSIDHHYVPTFYLRRWAGRDGRICEFSRPFREVKPLRKVPESAGFIPHLYTVSGMEPGLQSVLEDVVFKRTDQHANDALAFMLANSDGTADMPAKLRNGWSRYLMSLMHRGPEPLAALKEKCRTSMEEQLAGLENTYADRRQPSDPETYAEMRAAVEHDVEHKAWAMVLESVVDNPRVGTFINGMQWTIATIRNPERSMLTSDRPLHMTNGLEHPEAYIILPAGPTDIFIAVNTPDMVRRISETEPRGLVKEINAKVVGQAVRYVYDTDDVQLRFVENRLRREPSNPGVAKGA
jgi:hypothetical protein